MDLDREPDNDDDDFLVEVGGGAGGRGGGGAGRGGGGGGLAGAGPAADEAECARLLVADVGGGGELGRWADVREREAIRDRFVTGSWANAGGGAARGGGGDGDEEEDDEGGFEDLETGKVQNRAPPRRPCGLWACQTQTRAADSLRAPARSP